MLALRVGQALYLSHSRALDIYICIYLDVYIYLMYLLIMFWKWNVFSSVGGGMQVAECR